MRIAVSGTHFSGKSTLVASLLKQLPKYTLVDEPYLLLEEEGYEFSNPPTLEDFEQQLERSVAVINESQNNIIFDRCPLDYLAYALVVEEDIIDVESWLQKMEEAIERLDLIIVVPIEHQDRIPVPPSEDRQLRMHVNEKLQEILLDDSLKILEDIDVLDVMGNVEQRTKMVTAKLKQ